MTRSAFPQWGALALAVTLATGCSGMRPIAPPSLRVVLLPQSDADGQPRATAVEVKSGESAVVLNTPFALAERDAKGVLSQRTATLDEVQARYGDVLKIQPASPETALLRFLPGTSKLTPESESELPKLIALARGRAGGEILVVGHTDRQGSAEANDALSLRRAQAVADLLVAQGFSRELISARGRGEREPLVPTEDEVVEPRNRRAEIVIR
jgi:outer membrane protein OmpA-like peptidoglycan-associated protein